MNSLRLWFSCLAAAWLTLPACAPDAAKSSGNKPGQGDEEESAPDKKKKKKKTSSKVDKTGGKNCAALVGGQDTTAFPSTVLIGSLLPGNQMMTCSATFVGANVIATAGHCIYEANPESVRVLGVAGTNATMKGLYDAAVPATKVVHHGASYIGHGINLNDEQVRVRDFALVIFGSDIAPAISQFATARPPLGTTVDMIGFGNNVFATNNPNHNYRRQTGKNQVASAPIVPTSDIALVSTTNNTDVNKITGSFGDSGGTLLHGDKLAGVTSLVANFDGNKAAVYFIDVTSTQSQTLIQTAKAAGAKVGEAPAAPVSPAPPPPDPEPDEDPVTQANDVLHIPDDGTTSEADDDAECEE